MTFKDFLSEQRHRIKEFEKSYLDNHYGNPSDWPLEGNREHFNSLYVDFDFPDYQIEQLTRSKNKG